MKKYLYMFDNAVYRTKPDYSVEFHRKPLLPPTLPPLQTSVSLEQTDWILNNHHTFLHKVEKKGELICLYQQLHTVLCPVLLSEVGQSP